MQVTEPGRAFIVNDQGIVEPIKEDAVTYVNNITNGRVIIFTESRVNDMLKLDYSLGKNPELSIAQTDMNLFALALSLMKNLDSLAEGRNVIFEQINQDKEFPIKGSSPLSVNGRRFAVETLAQSFRVSELVTKDGVPFNRFFVYWKSAALNMLREKGLPVFFRFRDGYLYPETVTSDTTMVQELNADWMVDKTRVITDYKDGKFGIKYGVAAALKQDSNSLFSFYAETLDKASRKGGNIISGLENAPGFSNGNGTAKPKDAPSGAAIRLNGGDISPVDHGTRDSTPWIDDHPGASLSEKSVNGAIRRRIESGYAYRLLPLEVTLKPGDVNIEVRPLNDIYFNNPNSIYYQNILALKKALRKDNTTILIIIDGLKDELIKIGVATDLIFHPGVTRNVVYLDGEDLIYLLSLPNGVELIMEAINHEKAHIKNPWLSEKEIEAIAPSQNVRKALMLKYGVPKTPQAQISKDGFLAALREKVAGDEQLSNALENILKQPSMGKMADITNGEEAKKMLLNRMRELDLESNPFNGFIAKLVAIIYDINLSKNPQPETTIVKEVKVPAESIEEKYIAEDREELRKTIATLGINQSMIDGKKLILAYDTKLSSDETIGAIQAGEHVINKYLNGALVEVRGTGKALLEGVQKAVVDLNGNDKYVVVTIAGDATLDQKIINLDEQKSLGKIINVKNEQNDKYIPIIGLYDLALRIAFNDEESIKRCLARIASFDPEELRAFLKDARSGLLSIKPIRPINLEEAREVYRATEQALKSL